MNKRKLVILAGQTVFWMRADKNLSVRVRNGRMFKLQKGKGAVTLTHIFSRHFARWIYATVLCRSGLKTGGAGWYRLKYRLFARIGRTGKWSGQGWENSTTFRL